MGNGNIDVGNEAAIRKSGQPAVRSLSGSDGCSEQRIDRSPKTEHPCGAMLQQGGEFRGNVSSPQKFVHLVGCREQKAGQDGEVRRYLHPAKR